MTRQIDWTAVTLRVEFIVDTLKDCYVAEGWHAPAHRAAFDKAAERALAYSRRQAEAHAAGRNSGDWDSDFHDFLDFFKDYGQSIDWAFTGDARSYICRTAAGAFERGITS